MSFRGMSFRGMSFRGMSFRGMSFRELVMPETRIQPVASLYVRTGTKRHTCGAHVYKSTQHLVVLSKYSGLGLYLDRVCPLPCRLCDPCDRALTRRRPGACSTCMRQRS